MKSKSKGKLYLFHWEKEGALAREAALIKEGWEVETEFEDGARGCRNLKVFAPQVVVLDIAKKPSHSREVARALRQTKSLRETPLIFVDGSDEDISKVKQKVPAPLFTTSSGLAKMLGTVSAAR